MPLAWVSESQIESIAERSDRQVSAVGGDGGGGGGGGVLTVGGRQDAKAMEGLLCPDAGAAAAGWRGGGGGAESRCPAEAGGAASRRDARVGEMFPTTGDVESFHVE